jgi:glucosamine kinase
VSGVVVALDVGKTNLRAEVREGGSCRVRLGEGVRGWMGAPGPRAALLTQLAEVCGRLPDAGALTSAGAGIAGYASAAAEEKHEVSRALRMALPRARVRVASDARTAHLGAFRGEPGALLVAGTGAVALAVDPAGASYWAGGLGPDLGDEGSGGWIGREGCLAAARSIDGGGPATGLARRCERAFGVAATQLGPLVAASPSPAGLFGRFAPDVLDAWLAGDEQASRIAEGAAAHLAAAAIAVLRRLDAQSRRFAVVGGLSAHLAFTAAVTSRVAAAMPGAVCVPARGDALDGAALLAGGAVLPVPHPAVSRAARGSGA